jgi:hypothetical protein
MAHADDAVAAQRDNRAVPNCSGGLDQHIDGTIAGCTLDDDVDGCEGLEAPHEDAPEACWKMVGTLRPPRNRRVAAR